MFFLSMETRHEFFEATVNHIDYLAVSYNYSASFNVKAVRCGGLVAFRRGISNENATKLSVDAFPPIVAQFLRNIIERVVAIKKDLFMVRFGGILVIDKLEVRSPFVSVIPGRKVEMNAPWT
jgi:hypothetical protein